MAGVKTEAACNIARTEKSEEDSFTTFQSSRLR